MGTEQGSSNQKCNDAVGLCDLLEWGVQRLLPWLSISGVTVQCHQMIARGAYCLPIKSQTVIQILFLCIC
jgi:hypothetical protein